MRKALTATAAAAPLLFAAAAGQAQTVIDGEITEPVRTSTANDGEPDDVDVAGDVQVDDGTAVFLDSPNMLTISGSVLIRDADGAVGVILKGGPERSFSLTGTVTVDESYEAPNDDGDTDADGPFAEGSNRIGVLVEGPETFEGDITSSTASGVRVEGNDSTGVRVATDVDGEISLIGSVSALGDNTVGVDVGGDVSEDLTLGGSISTAGEGSRAAVVSGDVGGAFTVAGTVSSTGFRNPGAFGFSRENLDEDDLLDGGPALTLSGDVADGVRIDGASGTVRSLGSSQALLITTAGAEDDIEIGAFKGVEPEDGEDEDEDAGENPAIGFGLVNEGRIQGAGTFEGFDAIALELAGDDQLAILVEGGLYNSGIISASATEGDAEAVLIGDNVSVPALRNVSGGQITASSNTENGGFARAIHVAGTGVVTSLHNDALIRAEVVGEDGEAIAIQDDSGALTEVVNTNTIEALVRETDPAEDDDTPPGEIRTVAIDLSNAAEDAVIRQRFQEAPEEEDDGEDGGDGDDDGDEEEEEEEFVPPTPSITGDILFGAGDDLLEVTAGTVDGDISFGDGADQLVVDGGASVMGGLSDADGDLVIQVGDGLLQIENASVVRIKDASFGSESELRVLLGEEAISRLEADGLIHFEDGARVAASLSSLVGDGGSFEIVSAGELQIDSSIEELAETETPFIYNSQLEVSETNPNALVLTLSRKTAQELGLNQNEAAAYDAAFAALSAAGGANAAFAGVQSEEAFRDAYEQLLPDFSASALHFVLNNVDGATGAVGNRLDVARLSREKAGTGFWAQEFAFFSDRETTTLGPGFRGHGFGFAAGVDRPLGPFYAAGFNVVVSSNEIEQIGGFDQPMDAQSLGFGLYAGGAIGGLVYDFYAGAGVDWFDSERRISVGDFEENAVADWMGYHYSGTARIGYDWDAGWVMVRPLVSLDYLALSEDGYVESGVTDLNLEVADRSSDVFSATASIAIARRFGSDQSWWAPQLKFGYRSEFGGSLGQTEASFVGFSDPFVLTPPELPTTGAIIGFLLTGGSQYSSFGFNYDADIRDGFIRHTARVVVRLSF